MCACVCAGLEINNKTKLGQTPLHLAAAMGQMSVIEWLVGQGADKTILTNGGSTGMCARRDGNEPCDTLTSASVRARVSLLGYCSERHCEARGS